MGRRRTEIVLIVVFVSLLAAHALWREFDHDEFEHVHSAWYVSQGCAPYLEFFQHHHPLLWVALVPVILGLGESLGVLLAARIIMLVLAGGVLIVTWNLAKDLGVPRPGRRMALLLLVSQIVFFSKAIEIRPDVPALLLGLLGLACWVRGTRQARAWLLVSGGLAIGLSFVVLQKTVWFVIASAITLAAGRRSVRVSGRHIALAGCAAAVPVAGLLAWVGWRGAWSSYVVSNWLANASTSRVLDVAAVRDSLTLNLVFWAAAVGAAYRWGRGRHGHPWLRLAIWLAALLLCLQLIDRRPNSQDLLWPQTLLAIPAGHWLACVLRRRGTHRALKMVAVPLAVAAVLLTALQLGSRTNGWQLRRAGYVLEHTTAADAVYDGDATFNLFRRDTEYYWFARRPGSVADAHARLTGRPAPRDRFVERLVARPPAIAGSFLVDWSDPRLQRLYVPTPVDGLRAYAGATPEDTRSVLSLDPCWR